MAARWRSICRGASGRCPPAGEPRTRITDVFNDARQPSWSPDGKSIAFFAYRDGGYDLWTVAPDGIEPAQAHLGRRSTIASRPGRTTARASRSRRTAATRSAATTTSGCSTCATGELPPADQGPVRRLHAELVARRQRDCLRLDARERQSVWAVNVADRSPSAKLVDRASGRVDAPSWGPASQLVYHVDRAAARAATRSTASRSPAARTCSRSGRRGRRRPSSSMSRTARSASGTLDAAAARRRIEFTATLQVTRADSTRAAKRDFTSHAPRQALGIVRPVHLARRQADRLCRGRRHLRRCPWAASP